MDAHKDTAQVAAVLASRGIPARVVNQSDTYGVELLVEERTIIWTLQETGWCYTVMAEVDGGMQVESSGFAEVGIYDEPERVAFVIANFPYGGEMTDAEAREQVARLIAEVMDMSEEDRQAILDTAIPSGSERETLSWKALQETGLLWAINRQVFNPMGVSLNLRYEHGEPVGWVLLGEGTFPVQMDRLADIDGSQRFGAFMDGLSRSLEEDEDETTPGEVLE